jgi:hypothetical protein
VRKVQKSLPIREPNCNQHFAARFCGYPKSRLQLCKLKFPTVGAAPICELDSFYPKLRNAIITTCTQTALAGQR